jgi:hypothetical protein
MYLRTPGSEPAQGNGIMVFTLAGNKISAMTRFDTTVLPRFGLPRRCPPPARRLRPDQRQDQASRVATAGAR